MALALAATALPRCSPLAEQPSGPGAWKPLGDVLAVSSAAATQPTPDLSIADEPQPGRLPPPPRVAAPSAVVANLDTGEILFAKRSGDRRPIASLTKIMTAMIVLETTQATDVVTMSRLAARQIPTKLGLPAGRRMHVNDLLYALMLHSSNDVAVAFAQHVTGSVRSFDRMMNGRALALGLTDTRFASPSGLNDHGYSTARDLAVMTRWAYTSRAFASIVATKTYRVRMPGGQRVELRNLNNLLFDYRGAIGVKTGFTSKSRWSLVAVARRRGVRIVVVLLGDPYKPFEDGRKLLNWGFRAARSSSAVTDGRRGLWPPTASDGVSNGRQE